MAIKVRFEFYDALGNLMPKEEYTIQSNFQVSSPYALGVWVLDKSVSPNETAVIPGYLTPEQHKELKNNIAIKAKQSG